MNVLLTAFAVITDQLTKKLAKKHIAPLEFREAVSTIYFNRTKNYGFSNNFMSKSPCVVKAVTTTMLLAAAVYGVFGLKNAGRLTKAGFSLTLGGGFSNLADRYTEGYVTDFICKKKKDGTFSLVYNLADFFIVAGGIMFFTGSFLGDNILKK